jgi:hypothetical protein
MPTWVCRTQDTAFGPTINFTTLAYSSCSAQQENVLKEYNVNVEVLKKLLYVKWQLNFYPFWQIYIWNSKLLITQALYWLKSRHTECRIGFFEQGIGSQRVCIHIARSNYASSGAPKQRFQCNIHISEFTNGTTLNKLEKTINSFYWQCTPFYWQCTPFLTAHVLMITNK